MLGGVEQQDSICVDAGDSQEPSLGTVCACCSLSCLPKAGPWALCEAGGMSLLRVGCGGGDAAASLQPQ